MKRLFMLINLMIALFYPVYVGAVSGGWLRALAIFLSVLGAGLTLVAWSLEANDMAHEAIDSTIISRLSTAAINFVPAEQKIKAINAMAEALGMFYGGVRVIVSQDTANALQDEPESTK